jgi:hypothetical protein
MLARVGIVVAALGVAAMQTGAAAREIPVVCTNLASGASWTIRIDYDRHTVDSNSARISQTEISWHDAHDGSNYTLDRKSGALTAVAASSTGGYFLYDRCKLPS